MSAVDLTERIVAELEAARARQHRLLEGVSEADLRRQVSPLMSPLCWDQAHIAHYEWLWLVRALDDDAQGDDRLDDLYDAFAHPRSERAELEILDPDAARRFSDEVRKRTLDQLVTMPASELDEDADHPLLRRGLVYGMVIQHEHQHIETMLATLALMNHPLPDGEAGADPDAVRLPEEVLVPGGTTTIGTDTEPWAYDNERPAHPIELAPYFIETTPVTNEAYAEFVADGGYEDPRWWTEEGWAWCRDAELAHPQGWWREDDRWHRRRFGVDEALRADEPVEHVCWFEADAYARWRGKRLPTEAEWEYAATGGHPRRFPWGDEAHEDRAVLAGDHERGAPGPAGRHPAGASPVGVHDAIGGVWEWTASSFEGYPGFRAFPYREYSEVFFGDEHKVLRGGSWATHPRAVRTTFRNWDYPIRRQIFTGFRCARDARDGRAD